MPFQTDPAYAAGVAHMLGPGGMFDRTLPPGDYKSMRAMMDKFSALMTPPPSPDVHQQDFFTPAASDGEKMLLRWFYKPSQSKENEGVKGPAILHIHGGGMVLGSVASMSQTCASLVSLTGVPMLSVDYRLAPENTSTGLVEDCYAGLQYLVSHAAELGVDTSRIAVMGESAGGGLAAGLAIWALRHKGPVVKRQILVYPMLDDRIDAVPHLPAEKLVYSHVDNAEGWKHVLGEAYRSPAVDAAVVPNRIEDATGLPPLYVDTGEEDVFRDSCVQYATKHWLAGVSAELHVYPGLGHGFEGMAPASYWAQKAVENRVRVIKEL